MRILRLTRPLASLEEQYQRDRARFSRPEAEAVLGPSGRMIWHSKSGYNERFPDRAPLWNANICTRDGKIWFGDLDLHHDEEPLLVLSRSLGKTVYVLSEPDGRFFGKDEHPRLDRAVYTIAADGSVSFDERFFRRGEDGRLHRARHPS